MLTKKQKRNLDFMERNYRIGMRKAFKAPEHLIDAWARRFRIAIQQELQKRCKR